MDTEARKAWLNEIEHDARGFARLLERLGPMAKKLKPARGRDLDRLVSLYGIERGRLFRWAPEWLRFWPFWESDRAMRKRATAIVRGR